MISLNREIEVCYEDLIQEHDEIERLSCFLEQVIDDIRQDTDVAVIILSALAKAVAAHFRREDSFIYPGLIDGPGSTGSSDLIHDFEVMKASWQDYVSIWQRHGALSDWAKFARQTRGILKDLRQNALGEVGQLYAVGLREGLVTLKSRSYPSS